jgi:hypothetical protein
VSNSRLVDHAKLVDERVSPTESRQKAEHKMPRENGQRETAGIAIHGQQQAKTGFLRGIRNRWIALKTELKIPVIAGLFAIVVAIITGIFNLAAANYNKYKASPMPALSATPMPTPISPPTLTSSSMPEPNNVRMQQAIELRNPEWSRVLDMHNKVLESLSELKDVLEGKVWPLAARMDNILEDRRQGYQPQRQFVSLLSKEFDVSALATLVLTLRQECERDFLLGVIVLAPVGEKLQKVQELRFGSSVTFDETDGDEGIRRLLVLMFPVTAQGDNALNEERIYDCLKLQPR